MAKLILSDIQNLQNESTVVTTLTQNNDAIEAALENTLSRDGTTPNTMSASLDMNSNRIINLPAPVNPNDAARFTDVGDAPGYAAQAAAHAAAALVSETNAGIHEGNSETAEINAEAAQAAAEAAATQAQSYVLGLSGTSVSSVAIATGSKSFTASTGKLWSAGQQIILSSAADSANFMHGSVTSYVSGTGALVVNVLDIGGSGTFADWNINIAGTQGPQGIQGNTGPSGAVGISGTPTVNQFANWTDATTLKGTSITGLVKGNGASAPTAAVSGTDYAPATSGTSILKGSGTGGFSNATAGTDYYNPGGTDVAIADGGTGASTAPNARTNLGLGTGDSPQFTEVNVGHASDTTLARASAGVLSVEGVNLLTTATGAAQGKQTVWIPARAMTARTTNGAATGSVEMTTNKNMFSTLDFDTTTQEFAQFEVYFPKSWNLSTVTFKPVWSHASTTTNFGVVWGLAGIARSDNEAGDVAFGTAQTSTDTGGTTNNIYIGPESSAITIAGTPTSGDTVQFQLNRTVSDGGDTMAIDARLHGIHLYFTTNASTDA